MRRILLLGALGIAFAMGGVLQAATLTIANPSFEDGPLGNTVQGWTEAGGAAAHQSVTADPSVGNQAAQMRGQWTWNATRGISQVLSDNWAEGVYLLTFDAKTLGGFDKLHASLFATGPLSRVAQDDYSLSSDFATYRLQHTVPAGDPAIGQPIGVFLSNAGGVSDTSTNSNIGGNGSAGNLMVVDNVQLEFTAVPEPATGVLLAIAVLSAFRLRNARSSH